MYDAARRDEVLLMPTGSNSSYRDYDAQVYFWNLYLRGGNLAARPGTSNHGIGSAVDFASEPMWNWLKSNGSKYGWKKIEAFTEPWHWNYVGGYKPKPKNRVVKQGDKGKIVRKWQQRLVIWMPDEDTKPDGIYGKDTRTAVTRFQYVHGLEVDGKIGLQTKRYLERKRPLLRDEIRMVNTYWLYRRLDKFDAGWQRKWLEDRCRQLHKLAVGGDNPGWSIRNRKRRYELMKKTLKNEKW